MTIIDRVRSVMGANVRPDVQKLANSVMPGLLGNQATGMVSALITGGPKAVKALIPSVKSAPDLILGEAQRLRSVGAQAQAKKQADQLAQQRKGRPVVDTPYAPKPVPDAASMGSPPNLWTPAPLWGGMTLERYREFFMRSAMTPHDWKNLFFVSIKEFKFSKESPTGAGPINLLTLDASFSPCTLAGDTLALGSSNVDQLSGTERVELRLTTMDDDRGSLRRWFVAKADQAARSDGTFGVPADYLVTVTVMHMDPMGAASPDQRLTHRWLMRPSNIDVELSRRAPELGEVPMTFVQFDPFMVPK